MPKRYSYCAVAGCNRPVSAWSRWCPQHKARADRHGHPEATALPVHGKRTFCDIELRVARRYLELHKDHAAVDAAIELAQGLLAYRADTPLSADQRLERAFSGQRDSGADPCELLARVVAYYIHSEHKPNAWKSQRHADVALGRLVLHVISTPQTRWGAQVYSAAGQLARTNLGVFAMALLKRIDTDAARVRKLVQASAQL